MDGVPAARNPVKKRPPKEGELNLVIFKDKRTTKSKKQGQTSGSMPQRAPSARQGTAQAAPAPKPAVQRPERQAAGQRAAERTQAESAQRRRQNRAAQTPPQQRAKRAKNALIIAGVAVLVCVLAFLVFRFLRVKNIVIAGVEGFDQEEVIALSGVRFDEHVFMIDAAEVEKGINSVTVLEFEAVHYHFPDTVEIVVRECVPAAQFQTEDGYISIDHNGKGLGRRSESYELPVVTGMNVTEFSDGYPIRTDESYKLDALMQLLLAMQEHGWIASCEQIDVENTAGLYFVTQRGMKIVIGKIDDLETKFLWVDQVMNTLAQESIHKGTLDVSYADKAVYTQPKEEGGVSTQFGLNYDLLTSDTPPVNSQ